MKNALLRLGLLGLLSVLNILVPLTPATASAVTAPPTCVEIFKTASPQEVHFLSMRTILKIHERQLKQFGGLDGVRDLNGLEAAIEQPKASWGGEDLYPTVFDKAAVYAFNITESQAFNDGNKRTALNTALTFLAINGFKIKTEKMVLYDALMAISNKKMTKEDLARLFEQLTLNTP